MTLPETIRLERLTRAERDVARLQALLELAPRYARILSGAEVSPSAAAETLSALPPGRTAEDKLVFGALHGDSLVGCADVIRGYPDSTTAFIGLLLVGEPFEGRGYGSAMLAELEKVIASWRRCTTLRLGVLRNNERALRFWTKHGFVPTGEAKPHQEGAVSTEALIFERALSPSPPCPASISPRC